MTTTAIDYIILASYFKMSTRLRFLPHKYSAFKLMIYYSICIIYADDGFTVQIVIIAATVISVFVLVGMLLVLGLLVYTIKTKRKKNQRYIHFNTKQ